MLRIAIAVLAGLCLGIGFAYSLSELIKIRRGIKPVVDELDGLSAWGRFQRALRFNLPGGAAVLALLAMHASGTVYWLCVSPLLVLVALNATWWLTARIRRWTRRATDWPTLR
jgi:hypothetical protein